MAIAIADYPSVYVTPFVQAAAKVFSTMLKCSCESGEILPVAQGRRLHELTAVIGLSGQAVGAIAFSVSKEAAFQILERMTGIQTDEVDEFVRDVVGEMANMIAGHGKRDLEHLQLKLGLPQVIVGPDYEIFTPRWAQHFCAPLTSELGDVLLEVGFDVKRRGVS